MGTDPPNCVKWLLYETNNQYLQSFATHEVCINSMAEAAMVDYRNGVKEYPQGNHTEAAPTPARA